MNIDVDALIEKIPLVAENILEEAAGQPMLFVDAARFRVDAMRVRAKAERFADYIESRAGMIIRQRARANGDKAPEWAIKEQVSCNKKVRLARLELDKAEAAEEFAKLLLDAFKQRRDAIRITAESQLAEGMRSTRELEYIEEKHNMRETARKVAAERNRNR